MDESTQKIHQALQTVARLRHERLSNTNLAHANFEIKRFQAHRFQASYADLLCDPRYMQAAQFFLRELYSDKDYAERDEQFGKIAGTVAKLFPQAVIDTTTALAQVHALTESLDDSMARQWLIDTCQQAQSSPQARYVRCWRLVEDEAARTKQLSVVLLLGHELDRLTRKPGLRTLLKMMRRPAGVAGLSALQLFLESGFDAFAEMHGAQAFLSVIAERETEWIRLLFDSDTVTCETKLANLLSKNSTS